MYLELLNKLREEYRAIPRVGETKAVYIPNISSTPDIVVPSREYRLSENDVREDNIELASKIESLEAALECCIQNTTKQVVIESRPMRVSQYEIQLKLCSYFGSLSQLEQQHVMREVGRLVFDKAGDSSYELEAYSFFDFDSFRLVIQLWVS